MTKADILSYRASLLAVVAATLAVASVFLGGFFGVIIGIPMLMLTLFVGATSGITAVRATYQREAERKSSGQPRPQRYDYY